MQELRLVAVSEDGTYLVLATAGRGTRFTLPVDDRLRAAVRGNFSRLGQYEIEVESPLRPKEIQARIRAGETAEEIAATAGIPVERVRWFEGPVLQEREYMAQQAQRCAVRLPGDSAPGPTLGDLVAERLTRRGVPADEIDWDSAKRDDNLWRIKLGFVWNGHSRNAEWIFDPRRRHITPHDDEAMRLSAGEYVEPVEDSIVTPFVPRVAKLAPVPPLAPEPLNQPPVSFPSVVRNEPPAAPAHERPEPPAAYEQPDSPAAYVQPPMPPLPAGYEAPRSSVPPLRAPDQPGYTPARAPEPVRRPEPAAVHEPAEPAPPAGAAGPEPAAGTA
ncbi:septation protein SepH, partial [Streptosporangium sp. NPDC003464]